MTFSAIPPNVSSKFLHLEERDEGLKKFQADTTSSSMFHDYCQNKPKTRSKTFTVKLLCKKPLKRWNPKSNAPLIQQLEQQAKASGNENLNVKLVVKSLRLMTLRLMTFFTVHGFQHDKFHSYRGCAVFHKTLPKSSSTEELSSTPPSELKRKRSDENKENKGKKATNSPKRQKMEPVLEKSSSSPNPETVTRARPQLVKTQTEMLLKF